MSDEPNKKARPTGHGLQSLGKPDAGKPHVRFDERGWETELWQGMRHQQMAKPTGNGYPLSPKATSPIFDSTIYPPL
jgi:hypothetical protein